MSPRQLLVILLRRSWIILVVFAATLASAVGLITFLPPRYEAQATAVIDPAQADPITGQAVGATGFRVLQGNLASLAKSQRVAVDVVKRLNLTSNPALMAQYRGSDSVGRVDAADFIAADLLRNVVVGFNEGTNVMALTFKSPNPILAAQVANTFLAAFTDAAIDSKVAGAQQTADWFAPQTEKMRQEAEQARLKMSRFQVEQKLAPNDKSDADISALQQISGDLSAARAEVLKLQIALALPDPVPGSIGDTGAQPYDSTLMQSLKKSLSDTAAEVARLQGSLGANNPKIQSLVSAQKGIIAQIAVERRATRVNEETRLQALAGQIAALTTARDEQLAKVIAIQEQREQLALLSRDVEIKQDRYLGASKAASTARLQGQLSFSNIAILDKAATPTSPSFPKPFLVIPAAVAAGLGLGCILALIVEALKRQVRSVRDLGYASSAPSLGEMISAPVSRRQLRRQNVRYLNAPSGAAGA